MKGYPSHATARRDHVAVIAGDRTMTYGELDDRSSRLFHVLRDAGVPEGGRLAMMLPNRPEFVECLATAAKLAASKIGRAHV